MLGAQKQPKAVKGQEASPPSSLGDSSTVFLVMGQMGSVHREQAVARGWGTRRARQSGSPCFRSFGEGCGH